MVVDIKTTEEFDSYISKAKSYVIDFYATWCMPCKAISSVIDSLEKSYSNVIFLKVNVETFPSISSKYFVTGLPAMLFIKDGKVIQQITGNVDKSKISCILNQYMA